MSAQATKRPWKVDEDGAICATWENGMDVQIAITAHTHWTADHDGGKGRVYTQRIVQETKANAALIVAAVNERDGLLAQNRAMREALRDILDDPQSDCRKSLADNARTILAQVEGNGRPKPQEGTK